MTVTARLTSLSSTSYSAQPLLEGGRPLPSLSVRAAASGGLSAATLFADPGVSVMFDAVRELASSIGMPLAGCEVPAELARGGTVGRIGVPREAVTRMRAQQVLIGATVGGDPLAPVARLLRGLQRRADVLIDVRQCTTLPGSAAAASGNERDVLLLSQRTTDRAPVRPGDTHDETAAHWTRARQAADLAYRIAATEKRTPLLVLPIGRGTRAQAYFAEAMERQARLQRLPSPRTVKAGLLAALLSGEAGRERWLVASVIPIDELVAMAVETIGDTGPWPVISYGRDASFYDLPHETAATDPMPLLLVLVSLFFRAGHVELSRTLLHAVRTTAAAQARMQEELGMPLHVPAAGFLRGVRANWGRQPVGSAPRIVRVAPTVTGLRLRIETTLTATALRESVSRVLLPAGLEVASVRGADAADRAQAGSFDVRIRSRLGEPELGDDAAVALAAAFGRDVQCTAIEPLTLSAPSPDRPRRADTRRIRLTHTTPG